MPYMHLGLYTALSSGQYDYILYRSKKKDSKGHKGCKIRIYKTQLNRFFFIFFLKKNQLHAISFHSYSLYVVSSIRTDAKQVVCRTPTHILTKVRYIFNLFFVEGTAERRRKENQEIVENLFI